MRHPRIAAIGVVLDDDEPAAGPEVRGQRSDDRRPAGRGATKWRLFAATSPSRASSAERQRSVAREVGDAGSSGASPGSVTRTAAAFVSQRAPVAIDGDDPPARTEQVGQGQRERALPCPDVRPRAARLDRRTEQGDVIAVVHRVSRCSGARPRRR